MSERQDKHARVGPSDKSERDYAEFMERSEYYQDEFLELLVNVKFLNDAVCEVVEGSGVFQVGSKTHSNPSFITGKGIEDFERYPEY